LFEQSTIIFFEGAIFVPYFTLFA